MIQSQKIEATDFKGAVNWQIGTTPTILKHIHQKDVNITIYERDTSAMKNEIHNLVQQNIEFKLSGDIGTITDELLKVLNPNKYSLIIQDIKKLLYHFNEIANTKSFRLLLATINTNMCRKFHIDINDIRMLCTYSGPGTLWLTDDNINQEALASYGNNDCIVLEENSIQQAKTGAVVLLKGALYPQEEAKAAVHRSPTILESGEKRLLLRIDTNETLNPWI